MDCIRSIDYIVDVVVALSVDLDAFIDERLALFPVMIGFVDDHDHDQDQDYVAARGAGSRCRCRCGCTSRSSGMSRARELLMQGIIPSTARRHRCLRSSSAH